MTVTSHHADPAGISPERAATRGSHRIGVAISALVGAFLVFDAFGKLAGVQQVKDGTQTLGFPVGQALVMGVVLSVCVLVYAIPRTAVLGALGITAYLGGAVTANMRVEAPLLHARVVRGVSRRADVGRTRPAPSATADDRRPEALNSLRAEHGAYMGSLVPVSLSANSQSFRASS